MYGRALPIPIAQLVGSDAGKATRPPDVTTLTFVHHLTDATSVGDIGPGWEYYLDMLIASRGGNPLPSFGDYYPAQREYFVEQLSRK